jgi:hypothetical protein
MANPTGSPVGGSGLSGVTGKIASRKTETGTVTAMTGIAHRAPPAISPMAARSSRRTPIDAQSSAPVSTTSSRTNAT